MNFEWELCHTTYSVREQTDIKNGYLWVFWTDGMLSEDENKQPISPSLSMTLGCHKEQNLSMPHRLITEENLHRLERC